MLNAAEEFIKHIQDRIVKCASITHGDEYRDNQKQFNLHIGYTELDAQRFIRDLNFDYYHGYGGQELFGTIWYEDGTWSERGEYDGSEWWEYKSTPDIPEELTHAVIEHTTVVGVENNGL